MIARLRLSTPRAAMLSLALLVLLQLGGWVHHLAIDHELGEACELCVSQDRQATPLPAIAGVVFVALFTAIVAPCLGVSAPQRRESPAQARAPPLFSVRSHP